MLTRIAPAAAVALLAAAAHAQAPAVSFSSPTRFAVQDGAALYRDICQGCHMPDGRGAVGAARYPALAKDAKLEVAGYPVSIVVNGQRAMLGLGQWLTDAQIAAVVNYVRSHFGNDYKDAVSEADVHQARQ